MRTSTLTEAEFHAFVERLDSFTVQLTAQERNFVTTILLRACTSRAPRLPTRGLHPDSAIHAHLAYALWELTQVTEEGLPVNSLPLPATRSEDRPDLEASHAQPAPASFGRSHPGHSHDGGTQI